MNAPSDKKIDQLASSYGNDFTPDVEAGLRRLRRGLDTTVRTLPSRQQRTITARPGRRRWLGIAASLLVLATAGFLFFPDGGEVLANNTDAPLTRELADGTRVVLQQGAELRFAADYNETERRVTLAGQAYFEIAKDATRPFLVRHTDTELRVTGTAFNLRVSGEEMEVEVNEGSVELIQAARTVAVKARECGLAKAGQPARMKPAPHLNHHAWRTGRLFFDDVPLSDVLETLRNNYGVEIRGAENCDYPISATYRDEQPAAILEDVAKLGGIEVTTDPDGVFLLSGRCDR
ncbi:MAG: FecR domain-containing protein [Bacteroidota bacterium]